MVLFAHRETMFTVFVPIAPIESLVPMFRQALKRIEIPSAIIKSEIDALADMAIAKTNDRSTLGSMTQLASDLEWMADYDYQRGTLDLNHLQASLNETPHVQREEHFPESAVRKHLGLPTRGRTV